MTIWPPFQVTRWRRYWYLVTAADLLSLPLLVALVLLLDTEAAWSTLTLIWALSGLALWAAPFRQPRPVISSLSRGTGTQFPSLPVLNLLFDLGLLVILHERSQWVLMVLLNSGWAFAMLLTRALAGQPRNVSIGVFEGQAETAWREGPRYPASPGQPSDQPSERRADHLHYVPISVGDHPPFGSIDILLFDHDQTSDEYRRLLAHATATGMPIWSRSALEEELSGKVALEQLNIDWLRSSNFETNYASVKRVLDLTFTLLSLPLLLPLLALVALLVWINGRRPVMFWQERVGLNGVPFQIVKFRTMRTDTEATPAFATDKDPRITPLGAILRKFRLDELPQFWNVLRGEMSIIGPRPEQWAFAADFEESIPLYPARHWVRPGITGWAQVNQGYAADLVQTIEKLRYDLYYVKRLTFWLDLHIVFKTVYTILTGFGAR